MVRNSILVEKVCISLNIFYMFVSCLYSFFWELLIHALCVFFHGVINIFLSICKISLYIKAVNCLFYQLQTVSSQFALCLSVLLLVLIDIKMLLFFYAEMFLNVFFLSSLFRVILSNYASLIYSLISICYIDEDLV